MYQQSLYHATPQEIGTTLHYPEAMSSSASGFEGVLLPNRKKTSLERTRTGRTGELSDRDLHQFICFNFEKEEKARITTGAEEINSRGISFWSWSRAGLKSERRGGDSGRCHAVGTPERLPPVPLTCDL